MTELALDDPCVLFALRRESMYFRRQFRSQQRFAGAPVRARFCGPAWLSVLVAETGVGQGRTTAVAEWVASAPKVGELPYRPRVVLAAGFAGALVSDLRVGDVVLATEVIDEAGERWPTTWPGELTGRWEPPLHRGAVITTASIAADATEKRRLGERHGAAAADMESAAIARVCQRARIPFGCVRVISDDVDTGLSPRLASLLNGGSVSPLRVVGAVLRSPSVVREMWRLARDTRRAAERLGLALGELLTLTLPWGRDL